MRHECLMCQGVLHHPISFRQLWQLKPIDWAVLCAECQLKLEQSRIINDMSCQFCQRPLECNGEICIDCQRWQTIYDERFFKHQSLYYYTPFIQEWMVQYKYRGDTRQAEVLQVILKDVYCHYSDYVWTYLPSSPKSLKERGFQPVELLLRTAGVKYQALFDYVGDNSKQAKKNRQERLNLQQPFKLKEDIDTIKKPILILDDVYTTGTTLLKAKELVINQLQQECYSMTIARDVLK